MERLIKRKRDARLAGCGKGHVVVIELERSGLRILVRAVEIVEHDARRAGKPVRAPFADIPDRGTRRDLRRFAIAPVASAERAPTVSRQVALTDALAAKPVAQAEAVASPALASAAPQGVSTAQGSSTPQVMPQAVLSEAPPAKPTDEPGRFPVHKLVLALCGALGAASALRFIVRA